MVYMDIKNTTLLIFFITFLSACGGGDDPSTPANSCQSNNVSPDSITGPAITVKMTVVYLPETLPVNIPALGNGYAEHQWGVIFDLDGSGTNSAGDIKLELNHIKRSGSQPANCQLIEFESVVYEYTSADTAIRITTGSVEVIDNTIILKVGKNQHINLNKISNISSVQFNTITHDNDGQVYGDSYPVENSIATYISIPPDGMFTDTDTLSMSELLNVDVRHINLQTMEVLVD